MANAPLISVQDLTKVFGTKALFEGITLALEEGERTALIGPNGSGKSTLLRMLAGVEEPDRGFVRAKRGLKLSYVTQEDTFDEAKSIEEVLVAALEAAGVHEADVHGRVSAELNKAGFEDNEAKVSSLSGGWRKRLSIVRGLITEPELLLLDEPTNHLDIEGILWLEELIANSKASLMFVSHDRYFIETLSSRVIEINRKYPKGFFSTNGDYADFLEARGGYLDGLKQERDSLANKVRREVEWLRQGAKARTTKSKHRIAEAHKLQDSLGKYALDDKRATLSFSASERKTKELIALEAVGKSLGGKRLFKDVSLVISPGSRLGIAGANGSGKTSFVRTLLGEIEPDEGKVVRANRLRYAFFDQARKQLNLSLTLKQALVPDGDGVVFNGKPIHVSGWARRFLFTTDQLSTKVSDLSGGEKARLLLAKIMLEPADILLFDEPTNDLDIDTLEVLEESFQEFPGAIVLVTHDRYFLDRVANIVVGIGLGKASVYGSYEQWELARKESSSKNSVVRSSNSTSNAAVSSAAVQKVKLTYNEQQELSTIENRIVKAEKLLTKLQAEMNDPKLISDHVALATNSKELADQQALVDSLYSRWEELDSKRRAAGAG